MADHAPPYNRERESAIDLTGNRVDTTESCFAVCLN